jgi:hypothetical protein
MPPVPMTKPDTSQPLPPEAPSQPTTGTVDVTQQPSSPAQSGSKITDNRGGDRGDISMFPK